MKKLGIFFLILFFSTTVYAGTASLSETLEWKYGAVASTGQVDPSDMSISPKMKITEWNSSEPQPDVKECDALIAEYSDSQAYYAKRFDSKVLMGDLYQSLDPMSTLTLSPYTGALVSMMDWQNFTGAKNLIDALFAQGQMTEEDRKVIFNCFKTQGINLELL